MAICELATNSGSVGRGKPARPLSPAKSATIPFEGERKVIPIKTRLAD
jgi:hypothetical protein